MKTSTLVIVAAAVVAGVVIYRRMRQPTLVNSDGTSPVPDSPAGNTGIVPPGVFPTAPKPPTGIFGAITSPPIIGAASLDRAFNTR